MLFIKRIIYFVFFCLYFSTPFTADAESDFSTSFESTYIVRKSEQTSVTHTIALKNKLSHIYATNYTMATSGQDIKNITVSDETGLLSSSTSVQDGITSISMIINRPAIGQNQVKTLNISYQTSDVLEVIGDTYTINIPRLERANEAERYTRIIKVEGVEDIPSYIYPEPSATDHDDLYTVYTFDGHQNDSLSLLFGQSVTYKLNLIYELKNTELSPQDSELALPPDTPYQKVLLHSIDPKPSIIKVDESGNWLARYSLKSQEKLKVLAELYVTVYPVPTSYDPSVKKFVSSHKSKYWQTDTNIVQDLGNKLKTSENIYNYLVENFTYDFSNINSSAKRLGAQAALTSPSNVLCTEFTDAFVALARAQDIGAREVDGYGYTKNSALQPQNSAADILHAWPEYLDTEKNIWISIDPTWGNTTGGVDFFHKLDFSHIAFVRHGLEDSYPLPAGAYKSSPTDKNIYIEVATDIPEIKEDMVKTSEKVVNTGNVAIINDEVGYIPPYGEFIIKDSKRQSLYDKINSLCVKLLSIF
jgi:transglutaminase-like putative cysteine protease